MIRYDERTARFTVLSCILILDGVLRSLAYRLATQPDRDGLRERLDSALDERLRLMRLRDAAQRAGSMEQGDPDSAPSALCPLP
jgi:hypothetical protein